jgi:hypothetical protein
VSDEDADSYRERVIAQVVDEEGSLDHFLAQTGADPASGNRLAQSIAEPRGQPRCSYRSLNVQTACFKS